MNSHLVEIETMVENTFVEGELRTIHAHGLYTQSDEFPVPTQPIVLNNNLTLKLD